MQTDALFTLSTLRWDGPGFPGLPGPATPFSRGARSRPSVVRWPWGVILGFLPVLLGVAGGSLQAADAGSRPAWMARPLAMADCLNLALEQNAEVVKGRQELEATHGVSVQTRAVAMPKVQATGDYAATGDRAVDRLEIPPSPLFPDGFPAIDPGNQRWSAGLRLVQSLYEGGRMRSSLRTAQLLQDQVLAEFQAIVADITRDVRIAYYDVLLAEKEILVSEASVQLLQKELDDSQRRYNAGTVPRFNVLRAEVELANAQPRVARARNAHRLAKNRLVNLLGSQVPPDVWEDIPLQLSDSLEVPRLEMEVPAAIAQALARRPELVALQKGEELRREGVTSARAGYRPKLQAYAGYGARKSNFSPSVGEEVHGWETGVQATWSLFDGGYTRGKVAEARARLEQAETESDDVRRKIELEVRSSYSTLVEAWDVLESLKKVLEQAEEALRLARARAEAGTGTQLDVLGAQTALTDVRTTVIRAQREYAVARTRLERAIGTYAPEPEPKPEPR